MRALLMLRHGATDANERRVFTGARDIPLSPAGIAALAAASGAYPEAGMFFTSGMVRARQTLRLLYGEVERVDIPELSEYRFGAFEGRTHRELYETEPLFRKWLQLEEKDVVCPGGESRRMFEARVAEGWRKLTAARWEGLAVLVSHGGVLGCVMRLFVLGGAACPAPENGQGFLLSLTDEGRVAAYEAFPCETA